MKLKATQEELQRHFDTVINSAIDGIIIINEEGVIVDTNRAVVKLFGYSKKEMVGVNVSILMPTPHKENHDGYMHKYLKTGQAKIIGIGREVEGQKKDGTRFPFRLAVGEVKMKGGSIFTGFVHDLTYEKEAREKLQEYALLMEKKVYDRTAQLENINRQLEGEIQTKKRAEVDLIESQKLYEAIAINFPNGTINVLDDKLKFLFVEGSGLKEIGYGTKDLLGRPYLDLISPSIREVVEEKLINVFQGESENFEIKFRNLIFRVRAVPLPNENNKINRILLVESNITQQKKAEDEIFKSLSKEKELNELKSRFVSMASHEFRTPLSTILSSASLINRYQLETDQEKREKHTERIKGNVQNLTMILNDFLSLEKLDADQIRTNFTTFDLGEFMVEIREELETLKKSDQTLVCSSTLASCDIHSDKFMIQNILNNMVSNAIKYSGNDSLIEMKLSEVKDKICIQIADNGRGVSKADQKHLFKRFFRASNAGTEQGTGLGLHIVKRYVELLEGSISFESEIDKGTTFTILLNRTPY